MMYIAGLACSCGGAAEFRASPQVPLLMAARDGPCSTLLIPNGTAPGGRKADLSTELA